MIEVLSSDFDKNIFEKAVKDIINSVHNDSIYQKYFFTNCRKCNSKNAMVQHYKWENNKLYELGIACNCKNNDRKLERYQELNKIKKEIAKPNENEQKIASELKKIKVTSWYPDKQFHRSESFSNSFKVGIGGSNFSDVWTKRNLYVLSKIFNLILNYKNEELKKQLLYGFIQTVHLCTKMSVPRGERGNRPFSTSWGRSAYICSSRQMEMNPLFVFEGSCFGKQSVESSLSMVEKYLGKKPKLLYVDERNKSYRSKNFDIKYGIIDINTITDYLDEESIDFIMTDPPYGGLVQYLDLSSIWLIWLEKFDKKYTPNYNSEITLNRETQDIKLYKIKFQKAIKNLYKVLKKDGKIVFTFHNKKIQIWNAFFKCNCFGWI